jgi:adenosylcobinamide-phosphate synthase
MPFPLPLPVPGSPDLLLLLLAALTFDALLGDLAALDRLLGFPRRIVIAAALWCDRRLNRLNRSAVVRVVRGFIVTVVFAAGAVAAGLALGWGLRWFPDGHLPYGRLPYGRLIELLIVAGALSVRRPWNLLRATGRALEWKGITAGREAVRPLTGRHVYSLDEHGVVRVAIEGAAQALERQVVTPALWYTLLGLPGLLLWTASDGLARAIGDGGPRHDRFGLSAAWLHALMSYVPARLTALLVVLACPFVPKARMFEAVRTLFTAAPPGAATFAGALDLSLGGPRREGEVLIRNPWIGEGRARAIPADIRRALLVYAVACLLLAGVVATAAILQQYI